MVDSLKIHDILRAGNLAEEQARAMTAAIQKAESDITLDFKAVVANLATKADLANFATKADLADLRAEMADWKAEIIKWMFMFWAGHTAVILTVVFTAIKFLR